VHPFNAAASESKTVHCTRPLIGYYSKIINPETGKRPIVFRRDQALPGQEQITLSCGKCIACRLRYARNWAIRCVHEAKTNELNAYITLTYETKKLPHIQDNPDYPMTLRLEDWQKFMKRLREKYENKTIKFFHCGEYGEELGRPHYHACLFGIDWDDKVKWKENKHGQMLYTSETLSSLWGLGHCSSGDVTFNSASYVARYLLKKLTGKQAAINDWTNPSNGEVLRRKAEYTTNSNQLGKKWFEKWHADVYPADYLIMRGKKISPPPYYDRLYEKMFPEEHKDVKEKRQYRNTQRKQEAGSRRLHQIEQAHEGRAKAYNRNLGE